jgi:hypothetical protein
VHKSLYGAFEQTLDIVDGQTARLSPELTEAAGALEVTSTPAGARVLFDGSPLGTTPYSGPVDLGLHEVTIEHGERYRSTTEAVEVRRDRAARVGVTLAPRYGTIMVAAVANDGGAVDAVQVWLDGENKGAAPLAVPEVFVGSHTLTLRHPELEDERREITVEEGATAQVEVALRRLNPAEHYHKLVATWETERAPYTFWGTVQLAAGGVAAALGVALVAAADVDAKNSYRAYRNATPSGLRDAWDAYHQSVGRANLLAGLGIPMLLVGAAALVSGSTFWVMSPAQPARPPGVTFTAAPLAIAGGAGITGGVSW